MPDPAAVRHPGGLKPILLFLGRFLLAAALFGALWRLVIFQPYNRVLAWESTWMVPPSISADYLPESGEVQLVERFLLREERKVAKLNLGTLHFNLIPLLALIFATPGVPLKRRLLFIPGTLVLLALTHLIHMYLDIYRYTSPLVELDPARPLISFMTYYGKKLAFLAQSFMEQAGSMIAPFFLWLLFCGAAARDMLGLVGRINAPATD